MSVKQRTLSVLIEKSLNCPSTLKGIACVSLSTFMLAQFSLVTLLCAGLLFIAARRTVALNIATFKERGLISYLPKTLQAHLLDRSIFDLLCDLWYIPKTSIYLKALLKPFLTSISPEQVVGVLDDLPDNAKKTILTKGLINFLPFFV